MLWEMVALVFSSMLHLLYAWHVLCINLISLNVNCLKGKNLVFVSGQKRVKIAGLKLLPLERLAHKVDLWLTSRNLVLRVLSVNS